MKKLIFIPVILLLAVFGCKKDKPTTCTGNSANCEDIRNVKNFFYFKVGSWWVYEEENSGDRDSVYITQDWENPDNYQFDVRMYSTYQDFYYHFWPQYAPTNGCPESGNICKWCLTVKRSKYKPGDFVAEGGCFIFAPKVGLSDNVSNNQQTNNKIHITSILEAFELQSLQFDRTIVISEDNTFMEGIQPTNHYFSEGVGLVRKELLDSNKVWNLVNYHIVE